MARLRRVGIANRIIVRNTKVYASTLNRGAINGLFALRDIQVGEILVQYTGRILTQNEANASKSEYLFDLFYRSRPGADTVVRKTIDGWGELAGYANHAPEHLANASAVDILPTIIDNDVYYPHRHALVLVAKKRIPEGMEIRFPYNADQKGEGDMVRMMKRKGVTDDDLNNRAWLTTRYVTPPERNHAGTLGSDFMYQFIGDVS